MSDSEDDVRPPPPKAGSATLGDSSDDDAAPPPPPTDTLVDSDDEIVHEPKKGIATKLDKRPEDEDEGGDASDDMFGGSDSDDDSASGGDDPSSRRSIARRKSFGPDEEDEDSDEESDDDDDDDDDDEEDEEQAPKSSRKQASKGKKRSRGDEAEGDEDDAKKDKKKKSKKKKANNASRFFADMADDMGEDEEEEEGLGERGVTEEELTAEEMAANALVEERHAKTREMLSTDAAELAARYEAQHQQERKRKKIVQEMSSGLAGVGTGTVAQQALLPSVQDPSLWRVKCMTGKEFQLVRSVLLRHVHRQQQGARKNTLKSAFHSGAKGFIYIEAFSEVCAKEAVMGLRGLYASSFTKISIAEMTQVISTSVRKKPLREGQWVRLRRGPLRGDLARIVELLDGGSRAFVMAVPRPDYTSTAGSKSNIRHVQKIFDVVEAQQSSGIEAERRQHKDDRHGHYFDVWKNDYYKDGFWYKDVNVDTYVQGADVKPRLEELQMFRVKTGDADSEGEYDGVEGEEEGKDGVTKGSMQKQLMRELATQMRELEGEEAAQESQNVYRVDDLVEVMGGELRGVVARIVKISLTTNVLEVVPVRGQAISDQVLTVEISMVTKHIDHGMHVKVIGGRHSGNTGRVVSVNMLDGDHIAAILTDGVNSEIQVNVSNCQISAEVSIGHGDLGGFELYDCVSLSENETAVITHVGAEKLRVINHMNVVKDVYPQDISSKRNSQSLKQTAFDSSQTSIASGDIVKVVSGQDYLGKSGTVKHIMRGNLWIHSNNHLKNAGVMAIRGRSCVLAGSNTSASSNSRAANIAGAQGASGTIAITVPGGGGGRFGKDPAIGKTVKIIRGGFKGFLAQVSDANPTHFTVELLARVKKIMIERTKCKEVGDKDGAFDKTFVGGVGQTRSGDHIGPLADVATPFLTAETPMHMLGGETPMHMVGSETPMQSSSDIPNDDLFKVNEADRDRHTMAASISAAEAQAPPDFQVTPDVWDNGFIVLITQGDDRVKNRHGVLKSRMDAEGCFLVALIEHSGALEPIESRHHYTALLPADIMIGAHVRVLHGDPRVVGFTGRSTWLSEDGRDVMLSDEGAAGGTQMMKRAHCAVVYLDHN